MFTAALSEQKHLKINKGLVKKIWYVCLQDYLQLLKFYNNMIKVL